MERNLTDEEKGKLINCGALGYDSSRISVITGLDLKQVVAGLKNEKSEIFKSFQRGEWINEYLIDVKLIEMAQGGDLKAVDTLDARKRFRKLAQK
jgi:hypothetical protein